MSNAEYRWLTPESREFLSNGYLLEGQSPENRAEQIAKSAERILNKPGFADKFLENFKKGWYSLSSPIWSNFGNERGLPISCFGSFINDSIESILHTTAEVGTMTKYGGGTSAYFGAVRGRGTPITNNGESNGSVHFMKLFEQCVNTISQGNTRRGNFAAYLPVDHPDIMEFLQLRDEGNSIQDISFGVCVPEGWMQSMLDGDLSKRKIWAKVIESRMKKGYPYISFMDNINNNAPQVYKDKGLRIHSQNLCNEIALSTSPTESFVCDLSSMNILWYDEWKDTDAVEVLTYFLDAVMTEFIEKASKIKFMERAVEFARNQRALGIGWLGWHSYLQSKMIPFSNLQAKMLNTEIAKNIHDAAYKASQKMAEEYGEPPLLKGYGRRNTTLLAIAPTKSSAFILGQVSEGIEPEKTNYYLKDLAKGKFPVKNKYLTAVLEKYNKNTDSVWKSILQHTGSVQHLDFLTSHEKAVFQTFTEISPMDIVIQAAQRQKYIDQGQSLNLMIDPQTPAKDVNLLTIEAWKMGVKGLYYQFSMNAAQQLARSILVCGSCEA
jgi:ribonucleoside-diphosphate reductase alpha chain